MSYQYEDAYGCRLNIDPHEDEMGNRFIAFYASDVEGAVDIDVPVSELVPLLKSILDSAGVVL